MGLCIRDEWGRLEIAKTATMFGVLEPAKAEAWSLPLALSWIKEQNLYYVDIEMDEKGLHNKSYGDSAFQILINSCKSLVSSFPNSVMSFVQGQAIMCSQLN